MPQILVSVFPLLRRTGVVVVAVVVAQDMSMAVLRGDVAVLFAILLLALFTRLGDGVPDGENIGVCPLVWSHCSDADHYAPQEADVPWQVGQNCALEVKLTRHRRRDLIGQSSLLLHRHGDGRSRRPVGRRCLLH